MSHGRTMRALGQALARAREERGWHRLGPAEESVPRGVLLRGFVTAETYGAGAVLLPDGSVDGLLLAGETVPNKVTSTGRQIMRDRLLNIGPAPNFLEVGTGGTDPSDDQVGLDAAVFRAPPTRKFQAANRAIFKFLLTANDANQSFPGLAWTRSGSVVTITHTAHPFSNGQLVQILLSSDTAALPNGEKAITVINANSYSVAGISAGAASGTCTVWNGKTIREIGLFANATYLQSTPLNGGLLFARATFAPITKDNTIVVIFSWEFPFTSSG